MTFLLILVAVIGWALAFVFFLLFVLAGITIGSLGSQLSELKGDLEVYKNTANVFGRNSQGRFRND